jgi:hypothetical protein
MSSRAATTEPNRAYRLYNGGAPDRIPAECPNHYDDNVGVPEIGAQSVPALPNQQVRDWIIRDMNRFAYSRYCVIIKVLSQLSVSSSGTD